MESFLINYLIVLDDDKKRRESLEHARSRHRIESKRVYLYSVKESGCSEFEDLLSDNYINELLKEEGIEGSIYDFKNLSWAERNKRIFKKHGRVFDKNCENRMKKKIEDMIKSTTNYNEYFKEEGLVIINELINRVEKMILE